MSGAVFYLKNLITMSRETTQFKQILTHLESGKELTKLEALRRFGCWNSGDVIHKIRKEKGYDYIKTEMISEGEKVYARYKKNQD